MEGNGFAERQGDPVGRYDKEHQQGTRQRITEVGRRFKRDGIDGLRLSALMSDTGLTNAGFYARFASTGDLVANVVAEEPRMQAARYGALWPGARDSRISFATIRPQAPGSVRRRMPGRPARRDWPLRGGDTMMVGMLQMSHAVFDPKLADEVLEKGIENAIAVMR
ncbi:MULTISPECIES: TetR/AcrR family transcriptional regulator [Streptomyces]|uniref:TetR/AcrR family transcriptional regulator n=1 Tax=Streptomyces TaxID=1883 RepID=UPI0031FD0968